MKKIFLYQKLIILILIPFSCMDPVLEPEDRYSNYEDNIASKSLNNPSQGFPNGSFENEFDFWGGWTNGTVCELSIDSLFTDTTFAKKGDKALKINVMNGDAGVYSYFSYTPGDTLEVSFSYMIPLSNHIVDSSPAFGLTVMKSITDEDSNFLNSSEVYFTVGASDTSLVLKNDGNWHTITVSSSYSSLESAGTYFQFWFNEFSGFDYNYDEERELTLYMDNFSISKKNCLNEAPSEFSIIKPADQSQFNLDTLSNFQTIGFEWEESFDSDTILYTNRLVGKVQCNDVLISNGFESYETVSRYDEDLNEFVEYLMPNGWGTQGSNWWQMQTGWQNEPTIEVVDYESRSGTHSVRMKASDLSSFRHHTSLMYRLSIVNDNLNKDRIQPGTEVTLKGYVMMPWDDPLTGNNTANLKIMAFDDSWSTASSPVINSNYSRNEWHYFEVSMVVPERRAFPNTSSVFIGLCYNQFDGQTGTVFFDDVTISTSRPLNYFVTDYFDVVTDAENTVMSADYLKTLFAFIRQDLNGLLLYSVDFEWGIMATDNIRQVPALNSPVTFTVIDSSSNEGNVILNSIYPMDQMNNVFFNPVLSGE